MSNASETPNKIEKQMVLKAPIAKVWKALADHEQFGAWFKVKLEAPFEIGKEAIGKITHPGYEHVTWRAKVVAIEPETRLAFTWYPYAIDATQDYSNETPTLVEFRLEAVAGGTRLTLTESGFDKVPAGRRPEAFRMNDGGWTQQMVNIATHLGEAESANEFAGRAAASKNAAAGKTGSEGRQS